MPHRHGNPPFLLLVPGWLLYLLQPRSSSAGAAILLACVLFACLLLSAPLGQQPETVFVQKG